MTPRSIFSVLCLFLLLGIVAGCTDFRATKQILIEDGQYWQRSSTSSALYMRGPKAQPVRARDSSRCVVQIRELTELNAIRKVTPGDQAVYRDTTDPDTPAGTLAHWETPDRDAYLRAEHLPFQDFETCMVYNGWQRVEYLPYATARESRGNYIESILGHERRDNYERGASPYTFEQNTMQTSDPDFQDLNN